MRSRRRRSEEHSARNDEAAPKRRRLNRRPPSEIVTASPERVETALWYGKKIRHFRALTEHRLFPHLYGKLVAGESGYQIVTWIRVQIPYDPDGQDVFARITDSALVRRLYRFRKVLPEGAVIARTYLDEKFRRLNAGIDVLEELDALIRYQKSRIASFAERESQFPILVEQQRKEILALADLLKQRREAAVAMGLQPGANPYVTSLTQQVIVSPGAENAISDARVVVASFLEAHPESIPGVMTYLDAADQLVEDAAPKALETEDADSPEE